MAKKILSGVSVKVENFSGFDKSRLNLLTTHVGTITPIVKQLMLPGNFKLSLDLHSKLPPLAFDAYLRSHLKVEAFFVPMRLCYGGFESWFCGKEMYNAASDSFLRAKLPRLFFSSYAESEVASTVLPFDASEVPIHGGAGSLLDYLGVRFALDGEGYVSLNSLSNNFQIGPIDVTSDSSKFKGVTDARKGHFFSIFPHVAYALIYDEWYRNKLIQRPLFAPIDSFDSFARENYKVAHLPFSSFKDIKTIMDHFDYFWNFENGNANNFTESCLSDMLLDGRSLFELRQRNYGDDYFTSASPNAQEGSPSVVSTAGGSFTISALRLQNSMQEFKEVNNFASPDYRQTMTARYGVSPSSGVAQKPILLGSADYPYFTQGVENNANTAGSQRLNPFVAAGIVGSKSGVATANGSQFVCSGKIDEPGYLMVMATFVPEANYASGIAHDMDLFTNEGSLVDLPVGLLEHVGNEPIFVSELSPAGESNRDVFGYVQRYLWHKAGSASNEVHGLFRKGLSLAAAVPQRSFTGITTPQDISISSDFLRIGPKDLDGITSITADLSAYGIMIDASVDLKVSEPLCESALPSLSNPASEHGRSVYLKIGGSKIA